MRKQLIALLALLLSFALVAAACGSDDDDASDDGSSSASTSSSADEPAEDDDESTADMSDQAEEAENSDAGDSGAVDTGPVAGGTMLIQSTQVPRHLNGTVQSGYATAVPGTQLNASPLLFDENFQPQPYLAESWEIADDGLSVTLNLVQGAVFHDGEAITSEDVKFSMETSKANHPFKTMFAAVDTIDTPDDHTVVINLSEPHPAILLAMSPGLLPVIPEHVYNDGQEIKEHPATLEPTASSVRVRSPSLSTRPVRSSVSRRSRTSSSPSVRTSTRSSSRSFPTRRPSSSAWRTATPTSRRPAAPPTSSAYKTTRM